MRKTAIAKSEEAGVAAARCYATISAHKACREGTSSVDRSPPGPRSTLSLAFGSAHLQRLASSAPAFLPHSWPFLPRQASSSPTTGPRTQSSLCPPLILLLEPSPPGSEFRVMPSTSHSHPTLFPPDTLKSLYPLPLLPPQSKHKRRAFLVHC